MKTFKFHHHFFTLLFFLLLPFLKSQTQRQENNTGYTCSNNNNNNNKNQTNIYPCQTYAYYRATLPNYLDLATISDLFSLSRLMISKTSNISSPSSPLVPNQPLLIPLTCSCNFINTTFGSISYSNITYTIKPNDTFFLVSTINYQNLTTYPSVEVVNPNLVATNLSIGDNVIFPIFCKCPDKTKTNSSFMISYVVQPFDNVSSIASMFGTTEKSIVDVNGEKLYNYDTIFVPVNKLPVLKQPSTIVPSPPPSGNFDDGDDDDDKSGTVRGLAIGLGILGFLLILVLGIWFYRGVLVKKEKRGRDMYFGEKGYKGNNNNDNKKKQMDVNFMANVSDCLDKYRVFGFDELVDATNGFDESYLIQGSVYKGEIDGQVYAIKKMKWNAYEELKILQKVNHGNLVKLEGFCIEPEESNCYLVYEYVENGSLYSWLHEEKNQKLNWITRLRIAIDIANGLLYIHEHTRPKVVHKDIKSSNILLDSNKRAKIANFGLAKSGINAITMHIVGTQGYISPEYLADGIVSTKMDVFSFGVVLLELMSGKEVIDDEGNVLWANAIKTFEMKNEQEKARRLKEWLDKVILKETCSMESLMGVLNVAIACLHRDPSKRPSIIDIVYSLSKCEESGFELSDDGFSSQNLVAR
ncbi:lysM domain receptor kinase [Trifolium repens]|nr:lysM domain receptor kinase [Trifolium repens]